MTKRTSFGKTPILLIYILLADIFVILKRKHYLGATISSATATVYSMDNHIINCVLSDIPSQITGVKWNPATSIANSYTLADGIHGSLSQTSTLTISSHQLGILSLKNSGQTHTFTCEITVGTSKTPIRATQTIAVYTPSEYPPRQKLFDCELGVHYI